MTQRVATSAVAATVLLMVIAVAAQKQETTRPKTPTLTNDNMSATGTARTLTEDSVSPTNLSGSPIANARAALDGILAKMEEVRSIRIRLQVPVAGGHREIVVESAKPDRLHVLSTDGEIIMIGPKFYLRGRDGWQAMSAPAGVGQSDSGAYFSTFVRKLLLRKSTLHVTGQILGEQVIDGVDTIAYDFQIADGFEPGKIQMCVGKTDGYMRSMFLTGGGIGVKLWFTNINEPLSIEPPM